MGVVELVGAVARAQCGRWKYDGIRGGFHFSDSALNLSDRLTRHGSNQHARLRVFASAKRDQEKYKQCSGGVH